MCLLLISAMPMFACNALESQLNPLSNEISRAVCMGENEPWITVNYFS